MLKERVDFVLSEYSNEEDCPAKKLYKALVDSELLVERLHGDHWWYLKQVVKSILITCSLKHLETGQAIELLNDIATSAFDHFEEIGDIVRRDFPNLDPRIANSFNINITKKDIW